MGGDGEIALYFEDFQVGRTWTTPGRTVGEGEIAQFAALYDNQRLHLDAVWATEEGPFGGIIASGFQTAAVAWSLWLRLGLMEETGRGGVGLDELRWLAPVRPGDTLRAEIEVVDRSQAPKRGRGRVVLQIRLFNQRQEKVFSMRTIGLLASRAG